MKTTRSLSSDEVTPEHIYLNRRHFLLGEFIALRDIHVRDPWLLVV
jgi:hypothetical protein